MNGSGDVADFPQLPRVALRPQLPYPTEGVKALLLRSAASRLVLFTSGAGWGDVHQIPPIERCVGIPAFSPRACPGYLALNEAPCKAALFVPSSICFAPPESVILDFIC